MDPVLIVGFATTATSTVIQLSNYIRGVYHAKEIAIALAKELELTGEVLQRFQGSC